MWDWLRKLINDLLPSTTEKRLECLEIERDWEKSHNQRMQKMEDDQWDRDIEHRAQTMFRERNHELLMRKIKWNNKPHTEVTKMWMNSEPLIIKPLGKSACYMVHDKESAQYNDTSKIHDKLMERYRELIKEQLKQEEK